MTFDFEQYMQDLATHFIHMEEAMAEYYRACATRFPEHDAAWQQLIAEEQKHAAIFRSIRESLRQDVNSWTRGKFRPQAVQVITDDVRSKTRDLLEGRMAPKYALTFIADVENSLLESCLADAFKSVDPAKQAMVNRVQGETRQHRQLLRDILQKVFG